MIIARDSSLFSYQNLANKIGLPFELDSVGTRHTLGLFVSTYIILPYFSESLRSPTVISLQLSPHN